jgi:hypothetical protein
MSRRPELRVATTLGPLAPVVVRARRLYAWVELDLIRTSLDLTPAAQAAAEALLRAAVSRCVGRRGWAGAHAGFGAGRTFVYANPVLVREAEQVALELAELVSRSGATEPCPAARRREVAL